MISDTLDDCDREIERYLKDYPETYRGDVRKRIQSLLKHMEAVRVELDIEPESERD
jgi:hypothetical protein